MKVDNYSGSLDGLINNFPTKNKEGFTTNEIDDLLKLFPNIETSKFDDALGINTCRVIDNEVITYHCDILSALRCVTENREMRSSFAKPKKKNI